MGAGARGEAVVAATHGILSEDAPSVLWPLPIASLLITDSVPLGAGLARLRVVPLAGMLAEAIRRLSEGRSLAEFRSHR
jgi:phosphoribosylpyrophosphate synthetase